MKKIFIILILATIFLPTVLVLAVDDLSYTVLAPLPCISGSGTPGTDGYKSDCTQTSNETTLEKYLPGVFKLAIGLAAVAAVLMIVWGGIQYITTDAIMGKKEGKDRILNAIYSLVMIIGAWLILNTINPNLLNINLNIEPAVTKAPAGGTLGTSGLQPVTENALASLKSGCPTCNIVPTSTTGGEHDPNSAHYKGLAVDIAPNAQLNKYLTSSNNNPEPCHRVVINNSTFLWEPTGSKCGGKVASSGDHWHMSVTP